ncbi:MAG: GNAT family N-acetyltransferase [Coriobacteriales bacterium]|nr:GNAT family N-acetyltransferase [Coriobacteriales bacterium]
MSQLIYRHNRGVSDVNQHYAKKKLLPFYLDVRESKPERWSSWNVDEQLEAELFKVLQVKPRRTSSGVATITVITKPWRCSSDCLYCPNDLRMPKSYLSDEPACQRAERNFFDPYLQVAARLQALVQMGHVTDKVEVIVLGGTWSDYPEDYQIWFIKEIFRALNDSSVSKVTSSDNISQDSKINASGNINTSHSTNENKNDSDTFFSDTVKQTVEERQEFLEVCGLSNSIELLTEGVIDLQQTVNRGKLSYNQAIVELYENSKAWRRASACQKAGFEELLREQEINETAQSRVVGLVIETRSDLISVENLMTIRKLGCTKIQIGIQSLDPEVLKLNNRSISLIRIQEAFELLRLFGFKVHTHFMINLYGSSPEQDKAGYQRFVSEMAWQPDEVKLYPCSLVASSRLCENFVDGSWRPYNDDELMDVLLTCTLVTPAFIRISRMVRDISAKDILVGNKRTNMRQMVEQRIRELGEDVLEIRYREISTVAPEIAKLAMETIAYKTTATEEFFLQWVTPTNQIAGFLRLSLPKLDYVLAMLEHQPTLPFGPNEAMIREVHIYGKVARLHGGEENAQHLGLGRQLIDAACELASKRGYEKMNVISSVGTREYYRNLGFRNNGLYQQKAL